MANEVASCPHCGLAMTLTQSARGPLLDYDREQWRRRCKYVHLGGAGWCLVEKPDGDKPKRR